MTKRILPRGIAVAALVGLGVAFIALADDIKTVNPAKYEVAKVLPKLEGMTLKEGLNEVETTAAGDRISANVKNGKIVGWVVTDSSGKKVPTTIRKTKAENGKTTCWRCFRRHGKVHCFQTKCTFE